jgi:hypothetical protein
LRIFSSRSTTMDSVGVARVERGHRARAVDAHQPVGLGAAAGGRGQALHLLVGAQLLETVADGLRRHALQPQSAHRLVDRRLRRLGVRRPVAGLRVLRDQAEDQLAFASGVAGVDEVGDVQARLGLLDRREVEMRRDDGQVGEAPLAALDVEFLRGLDLHQVADRRRDDVAVILEMLGELLELARRGRQRADDVLRDAWLFRNDQCLCHLFTLEPRGLEKPCLKCISRARLHIRTRARPQFQCTE